MRGSTASEEVVARQISSSSRRYRINLKRLKPKPAQRSQDQEDEDEADEVEAGQQVSERSERPGAVAADGERDRAEGPDAAPPT